MNKNKFGVLILHGFASSLNSVSGIEPPLKSLGLPTLMPALRGHNQRSPEALRGATWHDWVLDAEIALQSLLNESEKVIVVGHSMGGLMALTLAANHPDSIDSIVPAAAAIQLASPLASGRMLHFLEPLALRLFDRLDFPSIFPDKSLAQFDTNYHWAPMDSISSFLEFSDVTRSRLPEVRAPALILQSRKDSIVAPVSAEIIYDGIETPPEQKRILWFNVSEHEMFRDCEREVVIDAVVAYVCERACIKS